MTAARPTTSGTASKRTRTLEIDPIGKLVLQTGWKNQANPCPPAMTFPSAQALHRRRPLDQHVLPRLADNPRRPDGQAADISSTGRGEQPLGVACSGFA